MLRARRGPRIWPTAPRAKVGGALVTAFLKVALDPDTRAPLLEHAHVAQPTADVAVGLAVVPQHRDAEGLRRRRVGGADAGH